VKAFAIILIVLCLAVMGGIGYLYFNATLDIEVEGCIATDAASQAETFQALAKAAEDGTLTGTLFRKPGEASPENCVFYSYTLKITNKTFLKAEVVEVSVTPMDGDMLQMGQNQAVDLDSGKSIGLTTTILTTKEGHNVREGTVTYYFWGIPFSRRITLK